MKKAQAAPNHAYSLRMMFALNDVLAHMELARMIESDKNAHPELKEIHSGIYGYLLRLLGAHLVEALDAFITKMPQRGLAGPSAVSVIVSENKDLKKLKAKLEKLMAKKRYEQLKLVRHNFVFHYNWDEQGAKTEAAVAALVSELEQGEPEVAGKVLLHTNFYPARFICADKTISVAWQTIFGFTPLEPALAEENSGAAVGDFIAELGVAFLEFSNAWLRQWLDTNDLKLEERAE